MKRYPLFLLTLTLFHASSPVMAAKESFKEVGDSRIASVNLRMANNYENFMAHINNFADHLKGLKNAHEGINSDQKIKKYSAKSHSRFLNKNYNNLVRILKNFGKGSLFENTQIRYDDALAYINGLQQITNLHDAIHNENPFGNHQAFSNIIRLVQSKEPLIEDYKKFKGNLEQQIELIKKSSLAVKKESQAVYNDQTVSNIVDKYTNYLKNNLEQQFKKSDFELLEATQSLKIMAIFEYTNYYLLPKLAELSQGPRKKGIFRRNPQNPYSKQYEYISSQIKALEKVWFDTFREQRENTTKVYAKRNNVIKNFEKLSINLGKFLAKYKVNLVSMYDLYNLRVNKGPQSPQPENQEQYPYQVAPALVQSSQSPSAPVPSPQFGDDNLTQQSNEDRALSYADQSPLSSAEQVISPELQLEPEYSAEVASPDAESSASPAYPAYPAPSEAQSQPPIESVGNTPPSLPSRSTKPLQPTQYQ